MNVVEDMKATMDRFLNGLNCDIANGSRVATLCGVRRHSAYNLSERAVHDKTKIRDFLSKSNVGVNVEQSKTKKEVSTQMWGVISIIRYIIWL